MSIPGGPGALLFLLFELEGVRSLLLYSYEERGPPDGGGGGEIGFC